MLNTCDVCLAPYRDDFATNTICWDQSDGDFVGASSLGSETTSKESSHYVVYMRMRREGGKCKRMKLSMEECRTKKIEECKGE